MKDREETIAWTMQYCQHYEPGGITMIGGKPPTGCCNAGVNYIKAFGDGPGIFTRIPCTDGNDRSHEEQIARCPLWLQNTREMGEKRADDFAETMRKMTLAGPVVRQWRTWTKKNRVAKQEAIDCPTGCGGKLHLSQAAYNGHVWGKCTTEDCLSWME